MRCVVNYVQPGREKYLKGQARLLDSLRKYNSDVATLFLSRLDIPGCPGHGLVSHSFKPWLMLMARNMGATEVLWLDASMVVCGSLEPIWKLVENRGYYFVLNGVDEADADPVENWITDIQAEAFGYPRGAYAYPQCSSGVVGLSFNQPVGNVLLNKALHFTEYRDGAAYGGNGSRSRHDQTVFSVLLREHNCILSPSDYMRYSWDKRGLDGVIVECRGIE